MKWNDLTIFIGLYRKIWSEECFFAEVASDVAFCRTIDDFVGLGYHFSYLRELSLSLEVLILFRIGCERLVAWLSFLIIEWEVIAVAGLIGPFHHAHPYLFQLSLQVDAMLALLFQLLQEGFNLFVPLLLEILVLFFVFFGLILDPTLFLLVFLKLVAEMLNLFGILFEFCILSVQLMLHLSNLFAPIGVEVTHTAWNFLLDFADVACVTLLVWFYFFLQADCEQFLAFEVHH